MDINGHPVRSRAGKIILAEALIDLMRAGHVVVEKGGVPLPILQLRVDIDRPDIVVLEALDDLPTGN